MIQYKINYYRTRPIEFDWKEFRNIQYTQKALNYSVEGYITMVVNIDKKGKVTKIRAINPDNKLLNEMAIIAINKATFKPAKKRCKYIDDSVNISININLPAEEYNFEFLGKQYKMEMYSSTNSFHRFVNISEGIGEKIKYLENAKLECVTYNTMQEFIEKDTITVKNLIGQTINPIEEEIQDMQIGGEKLLLFEKRFLNDGVCTACGDIPPTKKLLVKIKVLKINPINK